MGLISDFFGFGDKNIVEKIIAFFEINYGKSGSVKTIHSANGERVSYETFKKLSFSGLILKKLESEKISIKENEEIILLNGKVDNLNVEFYVSIIKTEKKILTFGWINKRSGSIKKGPEFDSLDSVLANLDKLERFWNSLTVEGVRLSSAN